MKAAVPAVLAVLVLGCLGLAFAAARLRAGPPAAVEVWYMAPLLTAAAALGVYALVLRHREGQVLRHRDARRPGGGRKRGRGR